MMRMCGWMGLAAVVALGGCGDDAATSTGDAGPDGGAAQGGGEPPSELALGTFNTGLVAVVKGVDDRRPLIEQAIADSPLDVLCLQELFSPIVSADFAESLSDTFPHSHHSALGDAAVGNGLLILSRYPLDNTQALLFEAADPSGLTDRMVIAADVVLGDARLHVMCSHLVAGLDADSAMLRADEIDEVAAFAQAQGYLEGPSVLLGDFNMGPDPVGSCTDASDPPCLAPDEAGYAKMLETFDDAAADLGACTQCRDAFLPLQVLTSYVDEPDQRIDHCFTRELGAWSATGAQVIFDEAIAVELTASDGSVEVLTTLSDHFGVRCDLAYVP